MQNKMPMSGGNPDWISNGASAMPSFMSTNALWCRYVLQCLYMYTRWGGDTSTMVSPLIYNMLEVGWDAGPQYNRSTLTSAIGFLFLSPI